MYACRNYSSPKLARFLRRGVYHPATTTLSVTHTNHSDPHWHHINIHGVSVSYQHSGENPYE